MFDTPYQSETSNWGYIVQTVKHICLLKVRPLNSELRFMPWKPLLYPIERNDIDFKTIDTFMVDFTNSCNLRCTFCYSWPQSKSVKLTDFDHQVMSGIIRNLKKKGKLRHIQVGCDFEPLLSDKFESYAEAFEELFKGRHAPRLGIITNGILLDPDKLRYYGKACGKNLFVRISFHSHKKEVFRSCVKGLDFDRLVNNITDVRESYPDLRIELCNVLTKLNLAEIPEYLDYVFNSLKANVVHFRRGDLSLLPDDKRAKLELEQSKFVELHDWLSSSDFYDVSPVVCLTFSEFAVWLKDTSFARWKHSFHQMLGVIRRPHQLWP